MAVVYKPAVYRTSGGDQLTVASSGVLELESGATLSLDGQAIATTGDVEFNNVTVTSGLAASSGTFTNGIAGSSATLTGGFAASSGTFSVNVAISSALSVGRTATFSSGASFAEAVTFTSGISATTGNFSGGVAISSAASVARTFTMSSAMVRPVQALATGDTAIYTYGVSQVWSCGTATGTDFTLAACTVAGTEKWITCSAASASTAPAGITLSGTLIKGAATISISTGNTNPQWIYLICETAPTGF